MFFHCLSRHFPSTHSPLPTAVFLTHRDDLLDLWIASEIGVIDDMREVILKAYSAFLDHLGIIIGLLPKVSLGEGRYFIGLLRDRSTSKFLSDYWTAFSSLNRYLQE